MRFHRCSLIFFVRYFEMASILASRKHRLEAGRRRGRERCLGRQNVFPLRAHPRAYPSNRSFSSKSLFPGRFRGRGGKAAAGTSDSGARAEETRRLIPPSSCAVVRDPFGTRPDFSFFLQTKGRLFPAAKCPHHSAAKRARSGRHAGAWVRG